MHPILCSRQNSKITPYDTHPCSTSALAEYGRICDVTSLPWLLGSTADFKKGRLPRWAWPNHNESLKVEFSLARGRRGSQRFKAHDRLDMPLLAWRWKRSESNLWDQKATAFWQYARNGNLWYMVARNWILPIKWMLESVFSPECPDRS